MNRFREVTRNKQALSSTDCASVLNKALRGILSVNGEGGYPYALPINHYYDAVTNRIYFHSGKTGYKVDCLKRNAKACYTVYDGGERREGEWWLTFKSVVAFGKIEMITDPATIAEVSRKLSLRFTQDSEYIDAEIEKYLSATLLLSLKIEHMTGKFVREK